MLSFFRTLAWCFLFCFLAVDYAPAQDLSPNTFPTDSLVQKEEGTDYKIGYKQLIIPSVAILYGVASLKIDLLKDLNSSTNYEIQEHKPEHIVLDNFAQYAPAAVVYGLNLVGLKGKHNFRDRSIIYFTSQAVSASIVYPIKHLVKERRPDGTNTQSFPSGHTATAFSSAQFLFREYKDTNLWISLSGYPIAVFTGVYRILNNRHWVGDVAAGAGIGIMSTEVAYWLYPKINRLLGGASSKKQVMLVPYYQSGNYGLSLSKTF
jgi:membrane-associated phospholipid phosphatase